MNSSRAEVAVVEGGALELVCTFLGRPKPVVEWSGPQDTLPSPSENVVALSGAFQVTSTLKVLNVSYSDGGKYSCIGDAPGYPAASKTKNFSVIFQSEFLDRHQFASVIEMHKDGSHFLLWFEVQNNFKMTKLSLGNEL